MFIDDITDSMDMSLSKLQEIAKDRGAWYVAVHGLQRVGYDLATEQQLLPGHQTRGLTSLKLCDYETIKSSWNGTSGFQSSIRCVRNLEVVTPTFITTMKKCVTLKNQQLVSSRQLWSQGKLLPTPPPNWRKLDTEDLSLPEQKSMSRNLCRNKCKGRKTEGGISELLEAWCGQVWE